MAKVYQANEIKNVAMVGGSGSGKTTLMESMLFECGVIKAPWFYRGAINSLRLFSCRERVWLFCFLDCMQCRV